jgi:inorganic triphosphatase YgiF
MKIGYAIRFTLIFILIPAFALSPLSYAETSSEKASIEDIKKETQDLLTALSAFGADQRDKAIQHTQSALEKLDKRIDAFETRTDNTWDNMSAAARKKARDSLKALRKQRIKVAEWYGSLKNSSADAWEHMKKCFSDAYKAFSDAWEKAEKEFGSSK